ncbi:MAG: glycoside hydrolase family 15 protein [Chloroflexota bacterium]|nr:MAG: glycoside hydrolase family 15 protein [Chloroflexota bacterium]
MADLFRRSIEIITSNQSPSGAYIACPNFPTYAYCWFRDGAFIAYAMDLAGEHASARRFHDWAARAINRRQGLVADALAAAASGASLGNEDILHTRYTLEGEEASGEAWPNFQLDGFGTWLWALRQHLLCTGQEPPAAWLEAAGLVAAYLAALWQRPCFDCWEEFPDRVHSHTLAAIYAGLQAHAAIAGANHQQVLESIRTLLVDSSAEGGYFIKLMGSPSVDASLIGLSTPYQVVAPEHPAMEATIARIERALAAGGGVHRYATDTYYGGGEWVLLAGWLGWHYAESGRPERARAFLDWMESQADETGCLPEQTPTHLIDPEYYEPWLKRWGPVARPLLWSHAMYIILSQKLDAFS